MLIGYSRIFLILVGAAGEVSETADAVVLPGSLMVSAIL